MRCFDSRHLRKLADSLILIFFCCYISIPLLANAFGFGIELQQNEGKQLAKRPTPRFSLGLLQDYPKQYQAYFNDNFVLRETLIRFYNYLKLICFHVSPSLKVILGKEGWLFYAGESNEARDYYRAVKPFTKEMLLRWEMGLVNRQRWLNEQGILYFVVFFPNKETLYEEFMPATINKVHSHTRLDQLIDHISHYAPEVNILDVRLALSKAKGFDQIYLATDSHWNDVGAFSAYSELLGSIAQWYPDCRPLSSSSFKKEKELLPCGGDLARMLQVGCYFREEAATLHPLKQRRAEVKDLESKRVSTRNGRALVTEVANSSFPTAVMFRDSFTNALVPLLSEHFSRICYVERHFDSKIVEAEKPNLVIEAFVERSLVCDSPFGEIPAPVGSMKR
ncbi:MAG: alginate O-acetyltransferase AlgX-related protein [Desulfomonilaceae bacterium]